MRSNYLYLGLLVFILCVSVTDTKGQLIKVTLLGTGCPAPVIDRFGPSTLIEAGDQKLIFDVGRGAIQRLGQINVRYKDVQAVFFTHLHSDHIVGFPDLWLTGWLNGRRDTPLMLFGPRGTARMMRHLRQAFEADIRVRIEEDHSSPQGVLVRATDVSEGVIYEHGGVRVTVFNVDHGPMKPAFGYRIDYRGRSVVLSGDTRPTPNLEKYAAGADLLIHEVVSPISLKERNQGAAWEAMIASHHTTPEQAGELFARTKPRLAVFSHIVLPSARDEDLLGPVRKIYSGDVVVGQDLMTISVGDEIQVQKYSQGRF